MRMRRMINDRIVDDTRTIYNRGNNSYTFELDSDKFKTQDKQGDFFFTPSLTLFRTVQPLDSSHNSCYTV